MPPAGDLGNAGRDTIPGPPTYSFNLSLDRQMVFSRERGVNGDFRIAANNAFNTPNFTGIATCGECDKLRKGDLGGRNAHGHGIVSIEILGAWERGRLARPWAKKDGVAGGTPALPDLHAKTTFNDARRPKPWFSDHRTRVLLSAFRA